MSFIQLLKEELESEIILSSEKPEKTIEEKLLGKITRFFGSTNDFNVAGFIKPNGGMINFSNQKEGLTRTLEHEEINKILEGSMDPNEFIAKIGLIKIDGRSGNFSLYKSPTHEQENAIVRVIKGTQSHYITLDLEGNGEKFSNQYLKNEIKPVDVIKIIREYYEKI